MPIGFGNNSYILSASETSVNTGDTVRFTVTSDQQGLPPTGFHIYVNNQEYEYVGDTSIISYFDVYFDSVGEYEVYLDDSLPNTSCNVITITVTGASAPTGSWSINNKTVQSLTIGNKEIQTITKVSDGAIIYQRPILTPSINYYN